MTPEELEAKRAAALADLQVQRDAAGARYASALAELHDSMVSLAALDLAIANSNVGGEVLRSFSALSENLSDAMHPVYAPQPATQLADDVRAQADKLIATFRRESEAA